MRAGEPARARKMPARRRMAYSPRGGSPVSSGLVPAGGDVGGAPGDQASISSTPAGSRVRQNVRSPAARTAIPPAPPRRPNGGGGGPPENFETTPQRGAPRGAKGLPAVRPATPPPR